MSTGVYPKQTDSPVQTRRAPVQYENVQNNNNINNNNNIHHNNRRSLSGKFRSLFRKSSSSPNRTTNNVERPPPPQPMYQHSTSPTTMPASTEAPQLRTPTVNWPFGKKKTKSPPVPNPSTNGKTKTKANKKTKKTTLTPLEISSPISQQEYQPSTYGQNFTSRTPEVGYGTTGRTHSSLNYETATKGFRDYVVIDHVKSPQQAITPNVDVLTPPYPVNNNRSPILNHSRLPDTHIEYSYHNDTTISPTISETEIFHTPKQRHKVDDMSSLTAAQILAGKTPLRPQSSSFSPSQQHQYQRDESPSLTTAQILAENIPILSPPITYSPKSATHSHQWMNTSTSSLNNTTMRSPTSSVDADAPKLNTPVVSLGHLSSTDTSKRPPSRARFDESYNSLSNLSNIVQPSYSYTSTTGSVPGPENTHSTSFNSLKPTISNTEKYPGLSAIVHYHLNPNFLRPKGNSSKITNTPQKQRFDASTTTLNDYDLGYEWPGTYLSDSSSPPLSTNRHDGYIRPLTPQKSSILTDVTPIHVDVNDSYVSTSLTPNRISYYNTNETPTIYRSSTTIYTKDKHNYLDGGEIRTWSIQDKDGLDNYKKSPTSIHIERTYNDLDSFVPTTTNDYQYSSTINQQASNQDEMQEENYIITYEYGPDNQPKILYDQRTNSNNRLSQHFNNDTNSNYPRSTGTVEYHTNYDQTTQPYQNVEHRQESLSGRTPVEKAEASLRHYTLKRSDSYDGLGVLISADAKTGLNPRIRDVEPGSPGYRAGLRKDDRIIYINGVNVENFDFSDVLILVQQGLNNNNLQLSVINEGIVF